MGDHLNLIISNSSGKPIYEQIKRQIVRFIEAGVLQPQEKLISVRSLAQRRIAGGRSAALHAGAGKGFAHQRYHHKTCL